MPPKKSQPVRKSTRTTRQSARRRENPDNDIPDVYSDMLAEAAAEEQASSSSWRDPKRRKLAEEPSTQIELDIDLFGSQVEEGEPGLTASAEPALPKLQHVVFDEFEGSDESDVEFEDVDLEAPADDLAGDTKSEQKSLELDLSNAALKTPSRAAQRRKPVGPAERKLRLDVHKAHLVLLLAHLSCRNRWCESESVHAILKPLVPRKVISLLHVDESKPQYQRSYSFQKGIEEICVLWRLNWTVTARGMHRAHWRDDVDAVKEIDEVEDLIDFNDFKAAAATRRGSRDLGAQLFCALLRSVAVDARLVCSLQVLPFSGVAKGQTPEKPKPKYYHAPPQTFETAAQDTTITRPERSSVPKKRKIVDSPFPVFWVEAFSPSTSAWMPLDPIVRNTINKPKTGFEPPASDQLNSMTYVVAFEDDGSAKDVTRRYVQWYNAKTRRQRVEISKGGEQWWQRTMEHFQKPFTEVRDEIEDTSLLKRAESEQMPRNVQDFKGHPVYALERHLRMNEVIHPRHEVGKVTTGPSKNAKLESVFRRRDVHLCRTADAWYRRGRDVNEGEQPLKRVLPKRLRNREATAAEDFEDDDEAAEGMALYAQFQTSLYKPPPVVDGRVPRNAYGNLDVYVPSMIPAGGVHIRHPLAAQAARVLDIDYADAVTGFEFKGRQGTAVIDGVVVTMQMSNAMINVIEGLESQATDEAEEARSRVLLAIWKRWLTALRVRERVHQQYGDREEGEPSGNNYPDDDDYIEEDEEYGGGFMREETGADMPNEQEATKEVPPVIATLKPLEHALPPEVVHQKIIVVRSPNEFSKPPAPEPSGSDVKAATAEHEAAGGFLPDDDEEDSYHQAGGFIPEDEDKDEDNPGGGGFIPEDEEGPEAGGFIPEDGNDEETPTHYPVGRNQISIGIVGGGGAENATAGDTTRNIRGEAQADPELPPPPPPQLEVEPAAAMSRVPVVETHDIAGGGSTDVERDDQSHEALTGGGGERNPPGAASASASAAASRPHSYSPSNSPTSLLSHDPDEEDAEPEWLLNSLGEMD